MKYLGLMTFIISFATHAVTLNCLNPQTQKKFKTRCSKVLDPMKFKRGERSYVNCVGDLEDGYQVGICEKVNLNWQQKAK